ncbi:serine/threonine protein kinase [bacterium]|nr:serine/threonine protein kinase [bacterium]
MNSSFTLEPGTLLDGRFYVVKPIKAGGMGAVYEVRDRMVDDRLCALKQMLDTSSRQEERQIAIDRFLSEVQVMQTLNHPGIPKIYSSFVCDNSFFFAMEFIQGRDLASILTEDGHPGLSPSSVVGWALQALDALKYLHSRNPAITHRDIKPSNLLLRQDGRLELIDFGISRVTNPAEGFWIGTPGYAPAEQQQGEPEPSSDLYALGASMHELLTGRKPKDWDFPPFEDFGVKVPKDLQDVIFYALGTWPEERYATAEDMANALKSLSSVSYHLPQLNSSDRFEEDVLKMRDKLYPLLNDIIKRYSNECHTPYLPQNFDFFEFTLAYTTPFTLRVVKQVKDNVVRFYEKQGMLEPNLIESVNPAQPGWEAKIEALVKRFIADYEESKGGGWGLTLM